MSQSCFSLGFFSQYSLSKLFTFRGYKGYLYWSENGMRRVRFSKQIWLVTWPRDLTESRANRIARLDFLSYSAPAGVTVHLLCMLHSCASFGGLPASSSNRESLLLCTNLSISSHSLTHYPYMIPT